MRTHEFFSRSQNSKKIGTKDLRETFLIVCEGERTEPNYFYKFPVKRDIIEVDIFGEGKNTDSLVMEAIRRKSAAEKLGKPYVQVWVVFDRDSFPIRNFQRAINLCDSSGIKYAVTNESFELWYLLHYNYYDSAMSRDQYSEKLSLELGRKYEKNQKDIYELLKDKQEQAIKRAKKLRKFQFDAKGYHDFCNSNPVTTVYELIEVLNDYIED
ncbi:RloB family protein [Paenibacillus sp. CMAA1364]